MKQKRCRWSFLVLTTVMLLFGAAEVQAAEPDLTQTIACGASGTNVYAKIENKVLIVSGSGPMQDYNYKTGSVFVQYYPYFDEIVIKNGVTKIGDAAFEGARCSKVTIENGVITIGERAFRSIKELKSITIPPTVSEISFGAFRESGLTSVEFSEFASSQLKTIGKNSFCGTPLASIKIPRTVTWIGQTAFSSTNVRSVTIPSGVTRIGKGAFDAGCTLRVKQGTAAETFAKKYGHPISYFECEPAGKDPLDSHAWDAGTITKAATCSVQGEKVFKCAQCGQTKTEVIPLLPHTFGDWRVVTQATVSEKGLRSRLCAVCGYMEVEDQERVAPTLALNSDQVVLNVGGSYKLKVIVKSPGDYVAKWKSSNQKVATVTSGGKIKAKAPGKTTIKVRMDSGISASVKVTVQKAGTTDLSVSVKGAKLKGKKVTVKAKKSFTLVAKVKPANSADKVKFSSSNKKVATVSSRGKVSAKKKGRAKITVKSGRIKATINVVVK